MGWWYYLILLVCWLIECLFWRSCQELTGSKLIFGRFLDTSQSASQTQRDEVGWGCCHPWGKQRLGGFFSRQLFRISTESQHNIHKSDSMGGRSHFDRSEVVQLWTFFCTLALLGVPFPCLENPIRHWYFVVGSIPWWFAACDASCNCNPIRGRFAFC